MGMSHDFTPEYIITAFYSEQSLTHNETEWICIVQTERDADYLSSLKRLSDWETAVGKVKLTIGCREWRW